MSGGFNASPDVALTTSVVISVYQIELDVNVWFPLQASTMSCIRVVFLNGLSKHVLGKSDVSVAYVRLSKLCQSALVSHVLRLNQTDY